MEQEFPDDGVISKKKSRRLFDTDDTIRKFNVFTDLEQDVMQWLKGTA